MKVTVSFGDVRVIVPCGDGSLLVSELIEKSKVRYRKACGKPVDHWIHVHTLRTSSDGGILDPDDQLIDVADDREQIIAYYDEQRAPSIPHNGGDGTSASSAGTASPDMFHGVEVGDTSFRPMYLSRNHHNDVIITPNDLTLGTNLTVRRGSEPSLNKIGTTDDEKHDRNNTLPKNKNKRWSAITSINDSLGGPSNYARDAVYSDSDMSEDRPPSSLGRIGEEGELSTFARDSARKSLGNMPGMYKWLEAQEKQEERYHQFHDLRKEPLGGHGYENGTVQPKDAQRLVVMKSEPGPLGIHVVPHYDDEAREAGLTIQGIEPGGRIHRDGQLAVQDRIVEINETSLMDVSFTRAQEVFKAALQTDEIRLKVIKHPENVAKPSDKKIAKQPPPTPPKPDMKRFSLTVAKQKDKNDNITNAAMVPPQLQSPSGGQPENFSKERPGPSAVQRQISSGGQPQAQPPVGSNQTVGQTPPSADTHDAQRGAPPVPTRAPNTTLSTGIADRQLITNTRKIGKKIPIQLAKGPDGLGFSITTRDNPAGGTAPIYVKNILPKGAAIADGRLQPGDRLLEVNGVDLSDKTQSDAVGLLRSAKLGSIVEILVSRQVADDRFSVPRRLNPDQGIETDDEQPSRETLRLDIPLNETGSAGLGVSVKGKTQKREGMDGTIDVGIFVKAVMHGGAASKDGRLRVNDQLISVNGQSLLGKKNSEAMELLRRSMQTDGPIPGYIQLVVSRKIGAPTPTPEQGGQYIYEHLGYDNKSPSIIDHDTSQDERTFKTIDTQSNSVLEQSLVTERKHSSTESPRGRQFNDSITLNVKNEESVMIEDDCYVAKGRPRPHSTIGFIRPTSPDTPSSGSSQEDQRGRRRRKSSHDDMTMDDSMVLFSREGFGRQSMSEKRRGHVDAKQMDFYQKLKSEKGKEKENETEKKEKEDEVEDEELVPPPPVIPPLVPPKRDTAGAPPPGPLVRVGSAESLIRSNLSMHGLGNPHGDQKGSVPDDIGPTLGMKKSSSLESLQAMVKEVDDEDDGMFWHGPSGVVRGRGCNESFRAAVDRSYDGPHVTVDTMESLAEEESETASQGRKSAPNSARSSLSLEGPNEIVLTPKGKGKQSKEKDKEKEKKGGGGIFKGLFKFGQKRKTFEVNRPAGKSRSHSPGPKGKAPEPAPPRQENPEQYRARVAAQEEQDRIQEHYRRLQEKQRQIEQHQPPSVPHVQRDSASSMPLTREERIQQLRSEHQRRHQERHGRYPHEDREEQYEEEIAKTLDDKLMEDQKWGLYSEIPSSSSRHSQSRLNSSITSHSQPQIYDGRPRHLPSDGHSYNNYETFDDVRESMSRHDQYRDDVRESMSRHDQYRDPYIKYQEALQVQQMQQMRLEQQRRLQMMGKYGSQNGHERARAATPVNAMGYMSHYNKKQYMGSLNTSRGNDPAGQFDFDYDDPRNAYQEPQYAVVQRRNKQPGPAKV